MQFSAKIYCGNTINPNTTMRLKKKKKKKDNNELACHKDTAQESPRVLVYGLRLIIFYKYFSSQKTSQIFNFQLIMGLQHFPSVNERVFNSHYVLDGVYCCVLSSCILMSFQFNPNAFPSKCQTREQKSSCQIMKWHK